MPSSAPAIQLSRVTTQYDQAEDRFRLLGSTSDEGTIDLWLTQRMLVRLVRVLLDWLEEKEPAGSTINSDDPEVKSSLQSFAQQNASETMVKSPPVKPGLATTKVLVTELDIRKSDEHVILVFKVSPEVDGELPFDVLQLRQWLGIVYGQWLKAEWPLAVWPNWIREGSGAAQLEDSAPMH